MTRARAQAADLAAELEALGATVLYCPTIEIIPPSDWGPLDASILRLEEYDSVIFTSVNGVEFFVHRLRGKRSDGVALLAGLFICAIGASTASALERVGVCPALIASDSTAEGALKEIVDRLGGGDRVRGLSFLMPRARVARDVLPAGLRSLGAIVDPVETYQTIAPQIEPSSIVRLFEANSVDVITFTSSSTVSNFASLLGLSDLSDLLRNTLVACIGPVTAETAAEYGLKELVQPDSYNAHGLVRSIVKAFREG